MFNDLSFLIYSSHKTSTQTMGHTLTNNNLKSIHCHCINDLTIMLKIKNINTIDFINALQQYIHTNNKRLKIITIIRNPDDRLLSSFFQSNHNDQIDFCNIPSNKTIVSINNPDELYEIYYKSIINKEFTKESIDELSEIMKINILDSLEKRNDWYYFSHELFELFVLDFNKTISNNALNYINSVLETNIVNIFPANLTTDKCYIEKYKQVKELVKKDKTIHELIKELVNPIYYTLF